MSAAIAAVPWWVWGILLALAGVLWIDHRAVTRRRARHPACVCGCLGRLDEHGPDGDDHGAVDTRDRWDQIATRTRDRREW